MDTSRRGLKIGGGLAVVMILVLGVDVLRDSPSTTKSKLERSPESEADTVAADGIADRNLLDACEVERQLTGILTAIPDPQTLALQVRRIL
jgi:hypothetical protein